MAFIKKSLLLVCFVTAYAAFSQRNETTIADINNAIKTKANAIKTEVESDSLKFYQERAEIANLRADAAEALYFEKQYKEYYAQNLSLRRSTFSWQLTSTRLIFFMVLLIVCSGLIFSAVQFRHSMKAPKVAGVADESDKTEIILSPTSIKITSSIIGLLVLCISIAFFYLYLLYVYPITQVNVDNQSMQTERKK